MLKITQGPGGHRQLGRFIAGKLKLQLMTSWGQRKFKTSINTGFQGRYPVNRDRCTGKGLTDPPRDHLPSKDDRGDGPNVGPPCVPGPGSGPGVRLGLNLGCKKKYEEASRQSADRARSTDPWH